MAVAQRMYARALFQAARDEGRLDDVAADFGALAQALEDVPQLRALLRNPQIDPSEKAGLLDDLTGGGDELVRNFVRLVSEKGRSGELCTMNQDLQALASLQRDLLGVE